MYVYMQKSFTSHFTRGIKHLLKPEMRNRFYDCTYEKEIFKISHKILFKKISMRLRIRRITRDIHFMLNVNFDAFKSGIKSLRILMLLDAKETVKLRFHIF